MKKAKIITLLVSTLVLVGLVGCGANKTTNEEVNTDTEVIEETTEVPENEINEDNTTYEVEVEEDNAPDIARNYPDQEFFDIIASEYSTELDDGTIYNMAIYMDGDQRNFVIVKNGDINDTVFSGNVNSLNDFIIGLDVCEISDDLTWRIDKNDETGYDFVGLNYEYDKETGAINIVNNGVNLTFSVNNENVIIGNYDSALIVPISTNKEDVSADEASGIELGSEKAEDAE